MLNSTRRISGGASARPSISRTSGATTSASLELLGVSRRSWPAGFRNTRNTANPANPAHARAGADNAPNPVDMVAVKAEVTG
jgi:hypothetical protein